MLRKADNATLEDFKPYGFKHGTRDRFIYKTKENGKEASIYMSLLPCNNWEIKTEIDCRYIPKKILDKLYDLIQARISGKGGIKYDRRRERSNRTRHFYGS